MNGIKNKVQGTIACLFFLLMKISFSSAEIQKIHHCSVTASFSTPASAVNLNVPVVFTNTSQGALRYQWLVDNVPVSTDVNLTHTFTVQNSHTVRLVAANDMCGDTTAPFSIQTGCEKLRYADKWVFGHNASVDFSSGIPASFSGTPIMQREGVTSIASPDGDLLFYSDGVTVWDAQHTVMPNGTGLLGSWLSAQSGVIVPDPAGGQRYYIFTVHNWTDATSEFCYSVIDMSLRGGRGDVLPGEKNVFIQNNIYERVTTARHKNCRDFWIISHERNNNRYVAYLLTATGLSPLPVVTDIGSVSTGGNRYGGLRASHSSRKMCSTLGGTASLPTVELLDFDNETGMFSNNIVLSTSILSSAYSSEFSSNDRVLYVTSYAESYIMQYDLYAGSPDAIRNSMQDIAPYPNVKTCVQMGPDGRIYVSEDYIGSLGVIEQPNQLGMACQYRGNAVSLGGGLGRLGLPNFIPSLFGDALAIQGPWKLCGGSEATYAAASSFCLSGIRWELSGPGSIVQNYGDSVRIKFSPEGGDCRLVAYGQGPCGEVMAELVIKLSPLPSAGLPRDTAFCDNNGITLPATPGFPYYLWNTHHATSVNLITIPGTYWVTMRNADGCEATDTINVEYFTAVVSLGADTTLCAGEPFVLRPAGNFVSYLWQDGSSGNAFEVTTPGRYFVVANGLHGCSTSDTTEISWFPVEHPPVFPRKEQAHCFVDGPLVVHASAGASFVWEADGSTDPFLSVITSGVYRVKIYDSYGCAADDQVVVHERCIPEIYLPSAFSPNQDGNNDELEIFGRYFTNFKLMIFNRWGEVIFLSTDPALKWDGKYRGEDMPVGTYPWLIHYEGAGQNSPGPYALEGSITLIR